MVEQGYVEKNWFASTRDNLQKLNNRILRMEKMPDTEMDIITEDGLRIAKIEKFIENEKSNSDVQKNKKNGVVDNVDNTPNVIQTEASTSGICNPDNAPKNINIHYLPQFGYYGGTFLKLKEEWQYYAKIMEMMVINNPNLNEGEKLWFIVSTINNYTVGDIERFVLEQADYRFVWESLKKLYA